MSEYPELEIGLHRYDANSYQVEFRFSQPESDTETRLAQDKPALARFDFANLSSLTANPTAYGRALSEALFADPSAKTLFIQARTAAQTLNVPLRLRLLIGPSAPELHSLYWENLQDPQDGSSLCTSETLFFSRYLTSQDWRPVRMRSKSELRALLVAANPPGLKDFGLSEVNVTEELARAARGLQPIQCFTLPSADGQLPATITQLAAQLQQGDLDHGFDILFIACHGAMVNEEPWLWIEDNVNNKPRIRGADLISYLKELQQRPRLIVLASCQSAGKGTGDALAALGPRLAEIGIPAVLAMQGNISMETIADFIPTFFSELQKDGQIDRAISVARSRIRQRPDSWMPALFMRLKSGRIWFIPGFGEGHREFEKWPAQIRSIKKGQCTPILGPGLVEPLLGLQREIARRWAEKYNYPMAPYERESLPQVAQFLAVSQYETFPYEELEEHIKQDLQSRFAAELPAELTQSTALIDTLIEAVGSIRRQRNSMEVHRALAQLPLPIFITTNSDNILSTALKEAGKDPQIVLCPWNEYVEQMESIYDREPDYLPSVQRPLVYHLFGRLNVSDSLVLTEDDYFDYLIGVTTNKELIPAAVRRALADTGLLFLGFQIDDWNFRVLFRSILAQQGGERRGRYAHIAVQIEPEEGRIIAPDRARRYLESYFGDADISIYWGSAEDFIAELLHRWNESGK